MGCIHSLNFFSLFFFGGGGGFKRGVICMWLFYACPILVGGFFGAGNAWLFVFCRRVFLGGCVGSGLGGVDGMRSIDLSSVMSYRY